MVHSHLPLLAKLCKTFFLESFMPVQSSWLCNTDFYSYLFEALHVLCPVGGCELIFLEHCQLVTAGYEVLGDFQDLDHSMVNYTQDVGAMCTFASLM